MLTLYTDPAFALNGAKVQLLLEEANQPYKLVEVDLPNNEHRTPRYLAKNPYGRLPFIEHNGLMLAESNTIMRYLAHIWELFDWYPQQPGQRALVEQWMDFGSMHINFPFSYVYVTRWFSPRWGAAFGGMDLLTADRAGKDLARNLPILNDCLDGQEYLVGNRPTLADLSILPFVALAPGIGITYSEYPHIQSWSQRMTARASWKKLCNPEKWPVECEE